MICRMKVIICAVEEVLEVAKDICSIAVCGFRRGEGEWVRGCASENCLIKLVICGVLLIIQEVANS